MIPTIVDEYLSAVDGATPDLLTALHLTGSIAHGDYRHGMSDVDGIAIVSRDLTTVDLTALRQVHESTLPDQPHVDVVYLTAEAFAAQPSACEVAAHSLQRTFHVGEPCFHLNPVTWAELAQSPVTARGDLPSVAVDVARLHAWNRENLASYWAVLTAQARQAIAPLPDDMPLPHVEMLVWQVLGPPRLHYTLVTGRIASKSSAGAYAAVRFPAYAKLIEACVRARHGETMTATVADARAASDLCDEVIADALTLPTQ